jgi:endonuclease/exonuclease/phosphatase family metal-dependent hydrolase
MATQRIPFLKIIQINTWGGHLLEPLCKFIDSQQPDIICAQEISDATLVNGLFDYLQTHASIKRAGSFDYDFYSPVFSYNLLGTKVRYGNAIYSKLPLLNRREIFIHGTYSDIESIENMQYNTRNLQLCEISLNHATITLANHHGFHDSDPNGTTKSLECMQKVVNELLPYKESLIVSGDLNVLPDSKAFLALNDLGLTNHVTGSNITNTLSSIHKAAPIEVVCDYILTSKAINTSHFSASEEIISDHKALILDFDT